MKNCFKIPLNALSSIPENFEYFVKYLRFYSFYRNFLRFFPPEV